MFVEGREYSRKHDIHEVFGGQERGGISTPGSHPFVFIFTGQGGEAHGYRDGWQEDEVFLYTGEGQVGDMTFTRGNRAIRDHVADGRELLLFEALGHRRPVRFMGRFVCQSWDLFRTPDRAGTMRDAIQFHLVRMETVAATSIEDESPPASAGPASLDSLRKRALDAARPQQSKHWRDAPSGYRQRSMAVREYVLARAAGKCELTGLPAPFLTRAGVPYLEVHHTRRLSDDGPDDPRHVAAIHPTIHREIHHGADGAELNAKLVDKLRIIEPD